MPYLHNILFVDMWEMRWKVKEKRCRGRGHDVFSASEVRKREISAHLQVECWLSWNSYWLSCSNFYMLAPSLQLKQSFISKFIHIPFQYFWIKRKMNWGKLFLLNMFYSWALFGSLSELLSWEGLSDYASIELLYWLRLLQNLITWILIMNYSSSNYTVLVIVSAHLEKIIYVLPGLPGSYRTSCPQETMLFFTSIAFRGKGTSPDWIRTRSAGKSEVTLAAPRSISEVSKFGNTSSFTTNIRNKNCRTLSIFPSIPISNHCLPIRPIWPAFALIVEPRPLI